MIKRRKNSKFEAPIYKIEVAVPNDSYVFLTEKAEEFSTKEKVFSVEDLANLLFRKSFLELEILRPTITKETLNYEVDNLGIFKELYLREYEEPEEEPSGNYSISLYSKLLILGIGAFNNEEQNFNLLRKLFNFDYDKKKVLEAISLVKTSDYSSNNVPECLINFEEYINNNGVVL